MENTGKFNSFADLSAAIGNGTEQDAEKRKKENDMKRIIAHKNKKWLIKEKGAVVKPVHNSDNTIIADKIQTLFKEEHSRKWVLHLMSNFLPMGSVTPVSLVKDSARLICPLSGYILTDATKIKVGDRDKNLGFSGLNSTVLLSGIAIYELNNFAIRSCDDLLSQNGQIVNYHLDKMRLKNMKEKPIEKRAKKTHTNSVNNQRG
jgi:hypothetical protein